jgi:acetyl esterase/lipase
MTGVDMLRSLIVLLTLAPAFAAGPPPVVDLWPDGAPGSKGITEKEVWVERGQGIVDRAVSSVHQPTLTVYLPDKERATGAAVVIAPGGGYSHVTIDKEGHDIAKWLNRIGVAGFVLKYRLPKTKGANYTIDTAFADTQRALRLVRGRAKEWNLDSTRIGMMGFSAGGDLAARAGTRFDAGLDAPADAVERESSRPDFLVIGYGAIPDDVTVTPETPPAFLVHADNDRLSSEKSVRFYLALKKAGVPAELHVYAKGGHGFGIQPTGLPIASWPDRCQAWMENQGLLRSRTISAYRGRTPTLDGKISPGEWDDAAEFFGVTDWVPQFSPTGDPKDLALHGYVKHDGKRLYFAFDVTDDVLYGIDTPRWLPDENPKAHELTREGFPWFGDEMELLINAAKQWKGREGAAGDGSSWQMVCNLTKSRKGGVGVGGLREGEPRKSEAAWNTYQKWILSGAQEAVARPKPGGKGYIIEWAVNFDPCLEISPGQFYSTSLGDRAMGLNIALGDLDEKERGAGNFGHFRHEDWFSGAKNTRTELRQWGTLWIRTSKMPARRSPVTKTSQK